MTVGSLQNLALIATQQAITNTGLEGAEGKIPACIANRIADPAVCSELLKGELFGRFIYLGTATVLDLSGVDKLNESGLRAILASLAKGRDLFNGKEEGVTAIKSMQLPRYLNPSPDLLEAISKLCPELQHVDLQAVSYLSVMSLLKGKCPELPLQFSYFRPDSMLDLEAYSNTCGAAVELLKFPSEPIDSVTRVCQLIREGFPNLRSLEVERTPTLKEIEELLEGLPQVELLFLSYFPTDRNALARYLSLFDSCPERLRSLDLTYIDQLRQDELDAICAKYPNIDRLRVCSSHITRISAPNARRVVCDNCKSLTSLYAPRARIVDCSKCPELTSLCLPQARSINCPGCPALTSLSAPHAAFVACYQCPGLTSLHLPKATRIFCFSCTQLTSLKAPWATQVESAGCSGLKVVDTPKSRSHL